MKLAEGEVLDRNDEGTHVERPSAEKRLQDREFDLDVIRLGKFARACVSVNNSGGLPWPNMRPPSVIRRVLTRIDRVRR
jgi:hypothetical protein